MARTPSANKWAAQVAEYNGRTLRFQAGCDTLKTIVKYITIVGVIYFLTEIARTVASKPKEIIEAMTIFIRTLQMDRITAYCVGVGGAAYGVLMRIRNRTLVMKVDGQRRQIEEDDPNRSSSGLTRHGLTPNG